MPVFGSNEAPPVEASAFIEEAIERMLELEAVRKKSIRELMRAIVEEDYLEEETELSTICSWAKKSLHRVPYFTTRGGKSRCPRDAQSFA